jgi:hypothetical protein
VLPSATVATLAMLANLTYLPIKPETCPMPARTAASISHAVCLSSADIEHRALTAPASVARTIPGLASYLTQRARTDTDKARALYLWIAANVRWFPASEIPDAGWLPQDARTILRRRTAVCAGFANLYAALAKASGLKANVVIGTCRGASWQVNRPESVPHAWNAVMIDGKWRLLDVSWGTPTPETASASGARSEPEMFYFLAQPERLITTHYPDSPRWQLLPRTLTRAEHEQLQILRPAYYRYGLSLPSHRGWEIASSTGLRMRVDAPPEVILMAVLRNGKALIGAQRLANHDGSGYEIAMDVPAGAECALSIYAKFRSDPGMFQQVLRYRVDVAPRTRTAARTASARPSPDLPILSP